NSYGQWEEIHGESDADLGQSERCDAAADRAGKTQPECLRRIIQWTSARRMFERALVRDPGASPIGHRGVAARVQPREAEESPRRADARRVCKAIDRKSDYNPGKTLNPPATQIGGTSGWTSFGARQTMLLPSRPGSRSRKPVGTYAKAAR